MPANVVKSVSSKCGMSKEDAEKIWKDAKKVAADEDQKEEYDYIMGIFKKMVGKECATKMGWTNENLLGRIESYLNEKS